MSTITQEQRYNATTFLLDLLFANEQLERDDATMVSTVDIAARLQVLKDELVQWELEVWNRNDDQQYWDAHRLRRMVLREKHQALLSNKHQQLLPPSPSNSTPAQQHLDEFESVAAVVAEQAEAAPLLLLPMEEHFDFDPIQSIQPVFGYDYDDYFAYNSMDDWANLGGLEQ